MTISQQIALWADRLRDIAAWGLRNSQIEYDVERYRSVQDISISMTALAVGKSVEELEPLRASVFSKVTPVTVGGAVVINSDGKILLIRRSSNGMWAMPSGALQVGETPAEGSARECWEETGVEVKPTALVGIFDSRISNIPTAHHIYAIVFLCEPFTVESARKDRPHTDEVLEVQWFPEDDLPPELSPGMDLQISVAYRVWRSHELAFFDREGSES